jgi:hypothetical protein
VLSCFDGIDQPDQRRHRSVAPVHGDGDVIVTLNRVISDVNVGGAAQIAANVCGVKVGPLAILGQAVDRSGATRTACETGSQIVDFQQN